MDKIIAIYLGGLAVAVAVEVVVARKMENMKDVFGRPIGTRHWLAWQATRLAYRIYPESEYLNRVVITDDAGSPRLEMGLRSTAWGGGLVWIDAGHLPAGWDWDEIEDVAYVDTPEAGG